MAALQEDGRSVVVTIRVPGGKRIGLTLDEHRLALLGLVDFDRDWESLLAATAFVVDGPAKAALIRERLLPVASHLPALLHRGVDALEMLNARYWFRQEPVAPGENQQLSPGAGVGRGPGKDRG